MYPMIQSESSKMEYDRSGYALWRKKSPVSPKNHDKIEADFPALFDVECTIRTAMYSIYFITSVLSLVRVYHCYTTCEDGRVFLAALAQAMSTLTIPISLHHSWDHFTNFVKPSLQTEIMRVIWLVPTFAMESYLSIVFVEFAAYFEAVRELYTAAAVYGFLRFIMHHTSSTQQLSPKASLLPVWMGNLPTSMGSEIILRCRLGVIQFVVGRLLYSLLKIIWVLSGVHQVGAVQTSYFNYYSPHAWVTMLLFCSQGWALYSFYLLLLCVHRDLRSMRPMLKFFCIKMILFFTSWQTQLIGFLLHTGSVHPDFKLLSEAETLVVIRSTIVSMEMVIAAVAFAFAFPVTDFAPGAISVMLNGCNPAGSATSELAPLERTSKYSSSLCNSVARILSGGDSCRNSGCANNCNCKPVSSTATRTALSCTDAAGHCWAVCNAPVHSSYNNYHSSSSSSVNSYKLNTDNSTHTYPVPEKPTSSSISLLERQSSQSSRSSQSCVVRQRSGSSSSSSRKSTHSQLETTDPLTLELDACYDEENHLSLLNDHDCYAGATVGGFVEAGGAHGPYCLMDFILCFASVIWNFIHWMYHWAPPVTSLTANLISVFRCYVIPDNSGGKSGILPTCASEECTHSSYSSNNSEDFLGSDITAAVEGDMSPVALRSCLSKVVPGCPKGTPLKSVRFQQQPHLQQQAQLHTATTTANATNTTTANNTANSTSSTTSCTSTSSNTSSNDRRGISAACSRHTGSAIGSNSSRHRCDRAFAFTRVPSMLGSSANAGQNNKHRRRLHYPDIDNRSARYHSNNHSQSLQQPQQQPQPRGARMEHFMLRNMSPRIDSDASPATSATTTSATTTAAAVVAAGVHRDSFTAGVRYARDSDVASDCCSELSLDSSSHYSRDSSRNNHSNSSSSSNIGAVAVTKGADDIVHTQNCSRTTIYGYGYGYGSNSAASEIDAVARISGSNSNQAQEAVSNHDGYNKNNAGSSDRNRNNNSSSMGSSASMSDLLQLSCWQPEFELHHGLVDMESQLAAMYASYTCCNTTSRIATTVTSKTAAGKCDDDYGASKHR